MKEKWALILGASSGFGGATARQLAADGYNIFGVHLDRRATLPSAEEVQNAVRAYGREAVFYNINAADALKRTEAVENMSAILKDRDGKIAVVLHSLAFGALKPFFTEDREGSLNKASIEMTMDVMANSLIYWTQDLYFNGLFADRARIFALSSAGSRVQWSAYGAVSAAKSALESYCRQINFELASRGITANALMAGVTDTPALRKIPGNAEMIETALSHNPSKRLTTPQDVANAISLLSDPRAHWISGDTVIVDGGEITGG